MVLVMFMLESGTETDRTAYAAGARVCVDGKMIVFTDQQPVIDSNGRILVPIRFPAQELGAKVNWLTETRQVKVENKNHLTLPDSDILLTIGKKEVTVNEKTRVMDTKAVVMGERTMVPLRFISEFMGAAVKWEGNAKIAFIFTRGQTVEEIKQIMMEKSAVSPTPVDKVKNIKILMYHEVAPLPKYATENTQYLYVEPAIFQQHLDILKKNGYNTITLQDLYHHWEYGKNLPANPIVLTFDDGYRSMYDFVMPELMKRDMVATFFIITDKFNHPGYVNESMVREMHKNGMEIASHSHTHCDLRYADLKEELNQSKKLLENIIDDTVYSFCYPYGLYNKKTINYLAQCEYKIAVTTKYGEASVNQNIYELKRIRINRGDQINVR
ncbi:MAG TPA: polysaccharide deacetylase family protein [Gelria sp.]|nr:polysaccharide deacetylase family protein [Gelria sp.]